LAAEKTGGSGAGKGKPQESGALDMNAFRPGMEGPKKEDLAALANQLKSHPDWQQP
jgi:hypothetical protein